MSLLQVQNVSQHFGSLVAVDGVTLAVEPGQLRAVIGPNGAGKTTFFNLISGFFRPTLGRIVFDGQADLRGVFVRQVIARAIEKHWRVHAGSRESWIIG